MSQIVYIPKCHVTNWTEFDTETPVILEFNPNNVVPDMKFRENVETDLDGEPCITCLGQTLEVSFTIPYVDDCDMEQWIEFIATAKKGYCFDLDLCDAGLRAFRTSKEATLRGNVGFTKVGHGYALTFRAAFNRWYC